MNAHISVYSTITGEQLKYFVPAHLGKSDFRFIAAAHRIRPAAELTGSTAPFAAIVAMRGRAMLSRDVIARSRSLHALNNQWCGKRLDVAALCALHAGAIGRKFPSGLRDSAVWVDGLRPGDAALVPCPSSMVPGLLDDYFAFMARADVPHWIRLAIGHYQLLMIHPFFDGNGRLSRLVALLHAQRFTPHTAMAIAAALALQRRGLRDVLTMMRQGDVHSYLARWSALLSAAEDAMEAAAYFARVAKCNLLEMLDSSDTAHRFAQMAIDEPLFSREEFASRLRISRSLAQSWLATLVRSGAVEPHIRNGETQEFRCPIAVEFWRQSMESLASSSSEIFADKQEA